MMVLMSIDYYIFRQVIRKGPYWRGFAAAVHGRGCPCMVLWPPIKKRKAI